MSIKDNAIDCVGNKIEVSKHDEGHVVSIYGTILKLVTRFDSGDKMSIKDNAIKVLVEKAKEYSFDGDRFHNFNLASTLSGRSPLVCLIGIAMKHFVSVHDILNDRLDKSYIPEKFGDAFNYCVLSIAMIEKSTDFERIIRNCESYKHEIFPVTVYENLLKRIFASVSENFLKKIFRWVSGKNKPTVNVFYDIANFLLTMESMCSMANHRSPERI